MRHRIHTSAIVFRADPSLVAMAADKARKCGVSVSEVVRSALRDNLKTENPLGRSEPQRERAQA